MSPADDGALYLWTVYDHPADQPDKYVARLWVIERGLPGQVVQPAPTSTMFADESLDKIRARLQRMGLYRLARMAMDDPVIVEVWL